MMHLPQKLDTIIHIGAGQGEELPAYLETDAKRILLVEPNPKLAEQLRRRTTNDERVQVLELAITDDLALNQLNEYNLPEAASLYQPSGLRQIFPGLRVTAQHAVATETPEQLLEQYPLVGDTNLLVIQAPGAESAIVNTLDIANKLGPISHIRLTLPTEAYYEGSHRADDTLQALTRRGYDTEHFNTENPDWPEYHLECNPLARRLQDVDVEKQSLVQALQQSKNENQYIQATLDTAKQELVDAMNQSNAMVQQLQEQLEAADQKLAAEQKAHAETREELQKHKTYLANRKQQLTDTEQKLETLQQQLKEQSASSQRFDQLEAKLAGITQNITGHMDKQLHNTSQQLEGSIALQGYLQGGQLPMKPAGPALSANMALHLAEQIETGQYDLIIEFGSGASTGFMARTVLKRLANNNGDTQRLGYQQGKETNGKELAFISPDEDDLPKRIISFEHRKEQAAKIEQSLTAAGLQHVVELVHTPLVDYQHQDQSFLHYGCEKTLERLANLYEGRIAKFLVLVNGPPSKTGPMARFPALPKLLNTLGTHTMDVVLGDSLGDDANTITERWCGLLDRRGISFRKEVIHNEKAATRLAINHA